MKTSGHKRVTWLCQRPPSQSSRVPPRQPGCAPVTCKMSCSPSLHVILDCIARAERLAYSPDEAAELLGISRELVHELLRTGQLGSVKAGRRRLIGKRHLDAFLAGEP